MGGSRGGQGVQTPLPENKKGFLSNAGPDPLKNYKANKPVFKWRFAGGPTMARFCIWILSSLINLLKSCQSITHSEKNF